MSGDILRGGTVIYSKVTLTPPHVRLVVDGVERDIALADGADRSTFEEAAGLAREVPVYLDAVWEKHADGSLHLDVMQTRSAGRYDVGASALRRGVRRGSAAALSRWD